MKKINLLVLSFALLSAVLIFSIAVTKAVESNEADGAEAEASTATTTSAEITTTSSDAVTTKAKPALTTNLNGQILERIPSPEQIKNFRVMKNENGTLYGLRVQNNNQIQFSNQSANANDQAKVNANANSAVLNSQVLEKIPSPDQIKNFKVMKKENGTLYGIRIQSNNQSQVKTETQTKTQEQARTQNRVVGADIKGCVATAINAKDEALKTRLTSLNNDVSTLIDSRNACQNLALESETSQAENLRTCAITFETKFKELNSATKENHKNIWSNYQDEMKACLPVKEVEEGESLLIEDGGSDTLEAAMSL